MSKFRKKPVVIEAFQMTRERRGDISKWPNWLNVAWNKEHDTPGALQPVDFPESDGADELEIVTLEGKLRVSFGDWIICGIAGEIYPCKPEIFAGTYLPVDAPHQGLPVAGYREQSDSRVEMVNDNKKIEERALRMLDDLATLHSVDKRWLAIGRTSIEQGFMAVNRAVFQPTRVKLPEDAAELPAAASLT